VGEVAALLGDEYPGADVQQRPPDTSQEKQRRQDEADAQSGGIDAQVLSEPTGDTGDAAVGHAPA
jgi:hypothetical protein